ncbi:MAG: lamin tail domain-containing protein [Pirellulales bacterium]|nr:lamin tail domain-containing protein [Pirellulales bacterium]
MMLDAGPLLITEFMAENDGTLADADGDFPDWIEIHNPTDTTVNLDGWYLTDALAERTKWEFPEVLVEPGGYLVVFASEKDRTDPAELHTNFQLDGGGEYLALIRPDGTTVAHKFAPEYPNQHYGVSYGLVQNTTTMVSEGSELSYLVPTAAEASLGTSWTSSGFIDSSWVGGRYEARILITEAGTGDDFVEIQNVSAHAIDTSGWVVAVNDAAGLPADVNDVNTIVWELPPSMASDQVLYRRDEATDPDHYWGGGIAWRTSGPGWVMIVDDTGGVVDFVVWGYSPAEIASLTVNVNGFDITAAGAWEGDAELVATASGLSLQRSGYADHGDATDWAFVGPITMGQQNEGLTTPFAPGGGPAMANGVGFELNPPGLAAAIQTDVGDDMHGVNASLWTRMAFELVDPSSIGALQLQMKYNDGFVAYLNGREIARRNAPEPPQWNSAATTSRSIEDSLQYEEINISEFLGELHSGKNVLAVHGLNASVADDNCLVVAKLAGTGVESAQRYFATPTPGGPNAAGYLAFVDDTEFDVDRGFYNDPITVTIRTDTSGATIRYTTDGSEPTEAGGTLYTGPLTISHTTTLRAAAFKPGYLPTNVDTQTYVFLDDVSTQSPGTATAAGWPSGLVNMQTFDYGMDPDIVNDPVWGPQLEAALTAIPTISLVTDLGNLVDAGAGIYVNAQQDGRAWERPTSVELIYPDGTDGFQIDAGLRIRGGVSRMGTNPKHAFRLFFRAEYGDAKLAYPLFGDEGVDTFDKLDLRTSQNYSWAFEGDGRNAMVRDIFSRDTQGAMGQPYTRSNYYHLYINGQYWGLYQSQERSEASYAASYLGGQRDDYDVVKVDPDTGYTIHATDGNLDAWQDLWNQASAGFATDGAYYRAQGLNPDGTRNPGYPVLLDVDNLIDYMLVIFYTGDRDGPISSFLGNTSPRNWYAVRDRHGEEGFQFFAHDAEHTLTVGAEDRTGPFSAGDQFEKSNPQWLHQQLMAHPEYRLRFADHAHEHLFNDGLLTPQRATARLQARADQIDMAIIAESARWGDAKRPASPLDKYDWLSAIEEMVDGFFPGRTQIVLQQLRVTTLRDGSFAPLYPGVAAPAYSQHGGQVDQGFALSIGAPAGVVYYTLDGSDPRLPGGNVAPDALIFGASPIPIEHSTLVKSRVLLGGKWSALNAAHFYVGDPAIAANLAVTELNYNPHDAIDVELGIDPGLNNDDFEFVELHNRSDQMIDLTGVRFTSGIAFDFTGSGVTELEPGRFVVIVRNREGFEARYGTQIAVAGQYDGSLDNDGERITLKDRFGQSIADFRYGDSGAWPGRADGNGSTLELLDPAGDYNDGANWLSSSRYGGTPGAALVMRPTDVVVNEVLSQPLPGGLDAIELYNTTGGTVDVGGWYLSDSSGDYRKFAIPGGTTVAAGAFLVFDENDFNRSGGPNDFALGAGGDDVWLLQTDTQGDLWFADHVEFGAAISGVTFGRSPDGADNFALLADETLGRANSAPRVGSVIINEIHYDPDVKTQPVEYVELYNAGSQDVDLSGWYFSAGISYTFPPQTTLPVGGYVVVAENPTAVRNKFGISLPLGPFGGSLSNDGESLVLRDADNFKQDEVDYQIGFPWPTVGDPPGYSIELINPVLDNDLAGSWRASVGSEIGQYTLIDGGSPWRYFKGTAEPSETSGAWRQIGFDDSQWLSGNGVIGYGEDFIETELTDMRGGYSTVYFRKEFEIPDPSAVGALSLEALYDDGINVWINGWHVADANVSSDELPFYATTAGGVETGEYVPLPTPDPSTYLVAGTNVIAVQLLNSSLGASTDAYFDAYLRVVTGGEPGATPGSRNSVYAFNAPPQMRQLEHAPEQPTAGEDVTITVKVTDPDGVEDVALDYQLVNPGDYISLSDSRYNHPAYWTTVAMYDDGTHGDADAGDDVYTAVLPGTLQVHRRLVRYRISVEDVLGASVTAPYVDDPQPNFAYYVYDGVPSWTGSARPGATEVTYSSELLESLPVYQLITTRQHHEDAMNIPYSSPGSYGGSEYLWEGTLIYDGDVYDHIRYRARGGVWRYAMGKNMWKFDFNRGHQFQARDDYGNKYATKWDKLNFSACIQQGDFGHRGEQGMFEAVGFKLFNLAGVESPYTNYVTFRIVEGTDETGANQYSGDFQGLYLVTEQPDGRLLDEHGLADGNFYKMEGGTGTLNNQGPTQPTNRSDLDSFMATYSSSPSLAWWRSNLDLQRYYSYRSIVEAIHHYDIADGKNYFYYHNPETGAWSVHPWDLDLTWANNMYGSGDEPFRSRVLAAQPVLNQEYLNRMREIRDLLYNPEQTGMLIDEMARLIYTPGELSLVDADCAMWDFNPILASGYVNSSKAGHDRFYRPPGSSGKQTFADMVQLMKNYVVSRGAYIDSAILSDRALIPDQPSVSYVGEFGYPVDGLTFRSSAFRSPGGNSFAGMAWRIAEVTDRESPDFDPTQPRRYEIDATWESGELATFHDTIAIPGEDLEVGKTYRVRVRMKDSAGRWSHWSAPVQLVAGGAVGPLATGLRITEINYSPHDPTAAELAVDPSFQSEDFEYVELYNTTDQTLGLGGVAFTDGIDFDFSDGNLTELVPGAYVVVVKNLAAFQARYGTAIPVAGTYSGKLSNEGEHIELTDPFERIIHDFTYSPSGSWPGRADGKGSSLEVLDTSGDYGDSENWRASREYGGSPGTAPGPEIGIVVNEVLSHTDDPWTDAIELHNTTGTAIDVSGWYLSDSSGLYQKFRIPAGTNIAAGGYLVFDEDSFNPTPLNPGPTDFALDGAHGDDVWLLETDATGTLLSFVDHVEFPAARSGESFGRWPNGAGDLVPMIERTLDPAQGANSGPRVGPILISEIHYNAGDFAGADDLEFIEICNPTSQPVDLTEWRVRKEIDYNFPMGTMLAPGAALVLVPFDLHQTDKLTAFRDYYGITDSVVLLGGYSGLLSNGGARVQLQRPDAPPAEEPDFIPRLLEDEVIYDDEGDWPTDPDGGGPSLHRLHEGGWGNDAGSWSSAPPTPGWTWFSPTAARVAGRYVFYNQSSFDGNAAAANAADDNAVATDKEPLLPGGTATFANYTSFSRGINGLMVDIEGLPEGSTPGADDFRFRVGNNNTPDAWTDGPTPLAIAVRRGAGTDGCDRLTILFGDDAVRGQWLQVTVLATANTGLADEDVFYFGNAVGEAGNSAADAKVNASDMLLARNNPRTFLNPAPIDFPYDFNRDARVNATDMLIARNNQTHFLNALWLITVPDAVAAAAGQPELSPDAEGVAEAKQATDRVVGAKQSSHDPAWLYEFDRIGARQRSPGQGDVDEETLDQLLAGYPLF